MAKTEHGVEVMVFKRQRMSFDAKRHWYKGVRRSVKGVTWKPVISDKSLLLFEYFSVAGLGEFLYELGCDSGVYDIRDWVHDKNPRNPYHAKLNQLARIRLKVEGEMFTVISSDLSGISRHREWRQRLRG